MASDVDIAWAAGLFEGEGSIEISREPRSRTGVRLHLTTTDHDVLEKFLDVAACGSIRQIRAASIISHAHWKTCWRWSSGQATECHRLLTAWSPYLGERRGGRAQEALTLLDEKEADRWRTCFCGRHFQTDRQNQRHFCGSLCRLQLNAMFNKTRVRKVAA